jgi:DNA-binding NarL/FixJ family response regulator
MTAAPVLLLIEPSSFVRSSIRQWLEDVLTNYRILTAETGKEALRLATQEKPTHILIETYLPEMSGFEVLQQVRQRLPTARIIATHWYESRQFLERVRAAGADGFVPKHRLHADLLPFIEANEHTLKQANQEMHG